MHHHNSMPYHHHQQPPQQHYHQPINPFRTPPPPRPADEIHSALLSNPWLKTCYVASVLALLIAVLIVASTAFSQILNPLETNSVIKSTHRFTTTSSSSTTPLSGVKPINSEKQHVASAARLGGGGVQSVSRLIPPLQRPALDETAPGGSAPTHPQKVMTYSQRETQSPTQYKSDDQETTREFPSLFPLVDEDTAAVDAAAIDVEDVEEGLIRPPVDVQMKRIMGETKEKVKQEMDQEAYSEHAFGLQQDGEVVFGPADRYGAGIDERQEAAPVHVVVRKSDSSDHHERQKSIPEDVKQRDRQSGEDEVFNNTSVTDSEHSLPVPRNHDIVRQQLRHAMRIRPIVEVS
jgi:hypothetical protein